MTQPVFSSTESRQNTSVTDSLDSDEYTLFIIEQLAIPVLEDAWTDDNADPGDDIISEREPGRGQRRQCVCQAGVGVKDDQHHILGGSQD